MTEDKIKVSYFEKIDVIRFLAAMMVVVYHAYERWISIWHYHKFMTTDGDGQNLNAAGKWINTGMLNGGFGVDAMGGPGCALATVIINWLWLLTMLAIVYRGKFYQIFGVYDGF